MIQNALLRYAYAGGLFFSKKSSLFIFLFWVLFSPADAQLTQKKPQPPRPLQAPQNELISRSDDVSE